MTVIRLFPAEGQEGSEIPSAREAASHPQSEAPRRRLRPADLIAKAASPKGAPRRVSPVQVITEGLRPLSPPKDFWAVWQIHSDYLRRRSVHFSRGNHADAEDALSTAMLRGVQHFDESDILNPRAWLLRILHNASMDQHRRRARQTLVDPTEEEMPPPAAHAAQEPPPDPEQSLARAQMLRALQAAMRQLPSDLLNPLVLHLNDWDDAAIADHLRISRELVRKRRQVAKDRLRQMLKL